MDRFILTVGLGTGSSSLNSFDAALYSSGVANYNLVRVSSILPAKAIEKNEISIQEGSVLHTAYAAETTNINGDIISAAIAVGVPTDDSHVGVIMEFSGHCSKEEAEGQVVAMVDEAMKLRGYQVKEIKHQAVEAKGISEKFTTVFAAIAMW